MKFKITDEEKSIIAQFMQNEIPPVYKTENTNSILFVYRVYFDICPFLLNGVTLTSEVYSEIEAQYKEFQTNLKLEEFDEYAATHYKQLFAVMQIFKKYYFACPGYSVYSVGVKKPSLFKQLKLAFRNLPAASYAVIVCALIFLACVLTIIFCSDITVKIVFGILLTVDSVILIILYNLWLFLF